jgi:predicted Rossmann fold flavoprotein
MEPPARGGRDDGLPLRFEKTVAGIERFVAIAAVAGHDEDFPAHALWSAYKADAKLTTAAEIDVAIIGAGAAGLMCAIECAHRGRRTAVLEHNVRAGRKILISGGGRCNFTNIDTRPENFISRNQHFAKSALARYRPRDFITMVERHGIRYHEKKLGQLFCDGPAEGILSMLERECESAGARIETACAVSGVMRAAGGFALATTCGAYQARSLIIASGGLSIPKTGATGFGYAVARQFGVRIVEPRPALVPLIFGPTDLARFGGLEGVSTEVAARSGGTAFREKMLFTHQGLSGPAILQASSYLQSGESVEIDLLPGIDVAAELRECRAQGSRAEVRSWLALHLPNRLALRWADLHRPSKPLAMTGDGEIERIAASLNHWQIAPAGTAGFEKAEVTAGGVDTDELSSKTFESHRVPGLYFIGEVVDVTGQLGGFNFQWAWASGYSAGQYA